MLTSAAFLAAAVFVACLFGIWTRPVGFLATFWPANAVMLGLLIRSSSRGLFGWLGGAAAFLAADLLTGSPPFKTLILTSANMAGVVAAYLVYTNSPSGKAGLRQPTAMLHLLLAAAAGGAAAGAVGSVANPILFDSGAMTGLTFWFATEFVNYVTILPVILSFPATSDWRRRLRKPLALRKVDIPPASALLASFAAAAFIGGPGAIAFPVPALLWCALVYPVFATAVLTLLYGIWTLVVISAGYFPTPLHDENALVSLRLGVSLVAIAPIMLACVTQSRNDLLVKLRHLAMHDPLTGVSNRKSFRDDARKQLADATQPCALLMFDLDHFKAVNDTYGHAAGDEVLIAFVGRIRGCLRAGDLFGRLGGEEFAVMVVGCSEGQALAFADRLRLSLRDPIILGDGNSCVISTSIGIAIVDPATDAACIDDMFQRADAMLYVAKDSGRDRAEISVVSSANSPEAMKAAVGDNSNGSSRH